MLTLYRCCCCSSVVMISFPLLLALTLSIVPAAQSKRDSERGREVGRGAIVRIMIWYDAHADPFYIHREHFLLSLPWPGKCFILMAFLECKLPQVAQCVLLCSYKEINYVWYIYCLYCIYISVWPGNLERGRCLRLRRPSLWIFVFCIDFLSCRCGSNLFRILL